MSSDTLLRRTTVLPLRPSVDGLDPNPSPHVQISEPERFVSAHEAAQFLAVTRRHLLVLARNGIRGAYPAGAGSKRNYWVFRLSELAAAITEKHIS